MGGSGKFISRVLRCQFRFACCVYVSFVFRDLYTPFSKATIAYCPLYIQRVIEEQYIALSLFIASITLLHFSSSPRPCSIFKQSPLRWPVSERGCSFAEGVSLPFQAEVTLHIASNRETVYYPVVIIAFITLLHFSSSLRPCLVCKQGPRVLLHGSMSADEAEEEV